MGILTPNVDTGRWFVEGFSGFRTSDDTFDNRVNGIWTHDPVEASAREWNEIKSALLRTYESYALGWGLTRCHNSSGGTLTAGTLVYVSGYDSVSGRALISKAQAGVERARYVVVDDILDGADGAAYAAYVVGDLDTSGATAVGDKVYLSSTVAGGFQHSAPTDAQEVGRVTVKDALVGEVMFSMSYVGVSGMSGFSGYLGDSGVSGLSGTSGISGYSGASGYSGTSGFSGTYSGFSGLSGYSGVSGYSGTSGFSGTYSGWSGTSGYSGAGTSGTSGFSGTFSGWSGTSGYSSPSGVSGYSGTSGRSGYSGPSGYSGAGGGSPGGINKNLQYNNSSTFGGCSGTFWDSANGGQLGLGRTAAPAAVSLLTLGGADTHLTGSPFGHMMSKVYEVQTADATPTLLIDWTPPVSNLNMIMIELQCIGIQSWNQDSTYDYIYLTKWYHLDVNSSTLTAKTEIMSGNTAGAAAWAITPGFASSKFQVTVTGEAAHHIDWSACLRMFGAYGY